MSQWAATSALWSCQEGNMSGRTRARGQLEADVMRILWDHEDATGSGPSWG
ncbi:hypothetical protein APR04_005668 [Promicromonospora umidemergens]|nr:hypothetical protein [Promicromonospora umidemergens]